MIVIDHQFLQIYGCQVSLKKTTGLRIFTKVGILCVQKASNFVIQHSDKQACHSPFMFTIPTLTSMGIGGE